MHNTGYHTYEFPECRSIVISGDIHGDFNLLVHKICVQYSMQDTLVIVAGDCGFGFERKGYYNNIVKRNARRMNDANNYILFIRGNHDNPAYFDGSTFRHKRFAAIPDYSVVKACGHTLLCIGGAVSIDRSLRLEALEQQLKKRTQPDNCSGEDALAPSCYWTGEPPALNRTILDCITAEQIVDTIITHTAPSFCELQHKNGLDIWATRDPHLMTDVELEREVMDSVYNTLKGRQPVTRWCYGHFHQSWHSSVGGILFKMLDIMEFYEIR